VTRSLLRRLSWVILPLLPAVGCGGHVPVPPELQAGATEIPVTERKTFGGMAGTDDPFVMGPYKAFGVDRTWRSGPGWDFFGLVPGRGASKKTDIRDFSFNFAGPGGKIVSACSASLVEYEVQGHIHLSHFEDAVQCKCAGAGLNAEARLKSEDGKWTAEALLHGYPMPMQVLKVDSNGVTLPKAVGYQVGGPQAIGLLEMRPPGRVWLANSLDSTSHAELACLFSALLLVERPTGSKK
jgi:hypothetical protein